MASVVLDWPVSINDHTRPEVVGVSKRMWRKFHYPESLCELLLYRDGTVIETSTLYVEAYKTCDDTARHGRVFDDGDWQVAVLLAAGYTLTPVP